MSDGGRGNITEVFPWLAAGAAAYVITEGIPFAGPALQFGAALVGLGAVGLGVLRKLCERGAGASAA